MTIAEAQVIARRQVEENTAKVIESVRHHCCAGAYRVKTPFMLYREMRAKIYLARGKKPDWKAIGHAWKHTVPEGLKRRLTGDYVDSILVMAHILLRIPIDPIFSKRIPVAIQGRSSFHLQKVSTDEVDTVNTHWLYTQGRQMSFYFPRREWIGYPESHTPIILKDLNGNYWVVVMKRRPLQMSEFDSCTTHNLLAICNGRSNPRHGTLTEDNVYTY